MKVLFLDIDGVVCLHDYDIESEDNNGFDDDCCRRLKEIIDITQCKLVLSSQWRRRGADILCMFELFKPFGITSQYFMGVTPFIDYNRGAEILSFVNSHPEIENYVAVDDLDIADENFPASRLVRTQENKGITEEIKNLCIHKLNNY